MRKIVFVIAIMLAVPMMLSAQQKEKLIVSNHSFSAQVIGLQYSYEQRLGGSFSLIGRLGMVPNGFYLYNDPGEFSFSASCTPAVTLEPRFYTNVKRRINKGKSTYKNAADFVSIKVDYLLEEDLLITPMYGIRRTFGKHWFGEFSAGAKLSAAYESILPYAQYRFGFVF